MSEDINQDRRRFTIPAGELGLFGPADAQSSTATPAEPPTNKDTRVGQRMTPAADPLPIEGELPSQRGPTRIVHRRITPRCIIASRSAAGGRHSE